jgi:hypothetical protein
MTALTEILSFHPRGRAIFCLHLANALPSLPSEVETKLGKTCLAIIASVRDLLESAASDDTINIEDLSTKLSALVSLVQLRAQEIEKKEYRPGDNYGFAGSADTYREIYRYLSAFVGTVADAAVFNVENCVNTFRGALKLYGLYSVDGDPKGAMRQAIEDAEEESTKIIAEAYRVIPDQVKNLSPEPRSGIPEMPVVEMEQTTPREAPALSQSRRNQVFISYSHKDKARFSELQTMLKPLVRAGTIDVWDDTRIKPGENWKAEIEKALATAKVAVLLVSANFLASDFIAQNELPPLLQGAKSGGLVILWIYVSSCLYETTDISHFQAAHSLERALDRMTKPNRQAVLSEICGLIKTLLA